MARIPTITYDRGTLLLHPPPKGKAWVEFVTWDDRVEKFRIPAIQYRPLMEALQAEGVNINDEARGFEPLELVPKIEMPPYQHQKEALLAWKKAQRQGVVVLPTAAGKTYLAPVGDAMHSAQYPGRGAHSGFNAPMVCSLRGSISGCGSGTPGWGFARSHTDFSVYL